MLPVSQAYVEAMQKTVRNPGHVWINMKIYNVEASNHVAASGTPEVEFSNTSLIAKEQSAVTTTYATLEPGRALLDGTQLPLPDDRNFVPEGFVSDALSDENGEWETTPTLTLNFTEAYGFSGLTLVFDTVTGDYLSQLTVTWYSGDVPILTETVQPTSTTYVIDAKTLNITRIMIQCEKSSAAYRRARIQKVLLGLSQTFDTRVIRFTNQIEDVDPLSRRLATETFVFDVIDLDGEYNPDNPGGYWEYVDKMTPISVSYGYTLDDGTVEKLEDIQYVLDGKPSKRGIVASFSAQRKLGALTGYYRKGQYIPAGVTLKTLAEAVLMDALGTPYPGETWWLLDDKLDTLYTTAPLTVAEHKSCLQTIAHAGMCALYTNAAGQIVMKSGWMQGDRIGIPLNNAVRTEQPVLTKISPLYGVDVLHYQYVQQVETQELFTTTLELNGTATYWFEYQAATDITIDVNGGTVSSESIYTHCASCTITASGRITVKITGKPLSTNVSSSPYLVGQSMSDETETSENTLVTSWENKSALERYRARYLELRDAYSSSYRGNPEFEAMDLILLYTDYVAGATSLILRAELSFAGSFSGRLIVKRLTNLTNNVYMPELYAGDGLGVL